MIASNATSADSTRKLNPLTSMRFIAAALIIVHHARGKFGIPEKFASSVSFGAGVTFFFVLSGFILSYVYASRPKLEKRRFFLARVARIWPAHVAAMGLMWLLLPQIFQSQFTPGHFMASLAMVHGWIPRIDYFFAFVSASWSISTEFGFYLLFLLLIPNLSRTWLVKLGASLIVLIAMIAVTNHLVRVPGAKSSELMIGLIQCNPLARLFEFSLGMATAHLWMKWHRRIRFGKLLGTLLEIAAFLLLGTIVWNGLPWAHAAGKLPFLGGAGVGWLARGGIACGACAIVIFVLALERGWIARLLSTSFLVLLGEISYSLYLVHQTIFIYFDTRRQSFEIIPGWLLFMWACALALVISYLVWLCIEGPCRRFLVGLWPRPSNAVINELPASMIAPDGAPIKPRSPRLVMPSRLGAVIGMALLMGLTAPAVYLVKFRPSIRTVTIEEVRRTLGADTIGETEVRFGDAFVLLGTTAKQVGGDLHIHLLWKSNGRQRLDWLTAVHFLDESGRILAQADHPQDTSAGAIPGDTVWDDFVRFPVARLQGAKTMGIGLLKMNGPWLFADRGMRDMGDRRLLVPLPELARSFTGEKATKTSLAGFFEIANGKNLIGWVWDSANPGQRLEVGIFDGETLIATVVADQFRPDLETGRVGDGRYGFRVPTPPPLLDGNTHVIHARTIGAGYELKQSPRSTSLGAARPQLAPNGKEAGQ